MNIDVMNTQPMNSRNAFYKEGEIKANRKREIYIKKNLEVGQAKKYILKKQELS